jgi:nucleoside-diphosphate-sugar epimerase
LKIRKAIITGATGPLGMALVEYLLGLGVSVTVVARPSSPRNIDLISTGKINMVECDLSGLISLSGKLGRDYDAFFHLGWNTASRDIINDPLIQSRNIGYTLDAVRLAYDLGCGVFVGAGSQAEYGLSSVPFTPYSIEKPFSSYGIAKCAAGKLSLKLCDSLKMRHCWGRVLSVYGPFDRETTAIMYCLYSLLRGESPLLTASEQIWDFIYSSDCARAFYLIARQGKHGVSYPVGSGKARMLKEYFEEIRDYVDPSICLGFGKKPYAENQVMFLSSDNTVLEKDTGFKPEYSFGQGIKKTVEWVNNRISSPR